MTNGPSSNIKILGFDEQFYTPGADVSPESAPARVTSVQKGRFTINDGTYEMLAEMSGKMLSNAVSAFDYPVVGDWVKVQFHNDNTFAIIHSVLSRKTLLKRKTPDKKIDFQLIAANIDTAFIIQALDTDFNLRRLERYLVMVNEAHIEPVVLLSKRDLMPPEDVEQKIAAIHDIFPELKVIAFSNRLAEGIMTVQDMLTAGKTYCLMGSSGVGKTTLLNGLIGEDVFKTLEIRENDGRGRHATTSRQLIRLENGALIIDTPGMRELGNFAIDEGLDETFSDILTLSEDCRFNDCSHSHEKGCAVLAAVETGELSPERYRNYLKLNKEAAYHGMSYVEKRRKDKNFGKMCKEVMKFKKNSR